METLEVINEVGLLPVIAEVVQEEKEETPAEKLARIKSYKRPKSKKIIEDHKGDDSWIWDYKQGFYIHKSGLL